ncbi:mixed lineage kinase domain-like protein isoform X2 [Ptychodera flava]
MLYRCFHRMTSCDSRHYVKVRGVVDDVETDTHWLVMEYEERGSLRNVISTHSGSCEWTTRVDLALGVCECLQLLHDCDQQTVLGKISSHKFLVGGDGQVKVYDFDFTDLPELASEYLKNKNCSYMPPGYLSAPPATYGVETECFGAGEICYEIATGKSPTEGESLPDDCPEEYQRVANGLKHQEPSKRMNIKDAVMVLRNLRRRLYAEGNSCSS